MARKTKEDALKTRQLLIESAIRQFAQHGVANTTLADIADAAGVTRGAVYWHFASKTELFNEIWRQQPSLADLIAYKLTSSTGQDPLTYLRDLFVTALQYIAEVPRQRALMQILYHKCEFSCEMIAESEIHQRICFNYAMIREILQKGIQHHILPAETQVEVILIILHSALSGIIKNWLMDPQRFDLYRQAPELVDNIMLVLRHGALGKEGRVVGRSS